MLNLQQTNIRCTTETMIYKPPIEARVLKLEEENVGTTNELYELQVEIDMLKIKIQHLENLVIGDNK
ncbi:MAG: hypothetical protein EBR82_39515 [Caulobacteraceae bacterium]|nr:hypothetical protein [Caulobacteraceae bacterium]